MTEAAAIGVSGLSHRYGTRQALDNLQFEISKGEIFGVLGPNGGGKTTLFRVLSTLLPVQQGQVQVCGLDLARNPAAVRALIGVTFQSPSLDRKLTVLENLRHQGHLYGLSGQPLRLRMEGLLTQFGLSDRHHDLAETLSGGMQRRVEIAKGLLHEPRVLLLDEPSTGLDPGARIDLWQFLEQLRQERQVTVVVTTHLMDEAERCDRLVILDTGRLVAHGTPAELRSSIGGDCVTIQCAAPDDLALRIDARFRVSARVMGQQLRVEVPAGHEFLRDAVAEFGGEIEQVTLGKPTLEDVFVARTGHRFWNA